MWGMTGNVIILFGGKSEERRVSVASAQNVASVLSTATLWFVNVEGIVFPVPRERLLEHERPFERDFQPKVSAFALELSQALHLLEASGDLPDPAFFLAFHGGEEEGGHLQRLLESHRVPFTGSGAVASERAMDKRVAKQIAREAGIRVVEEREIGTRDPGARDVIRAMMEVHGEIILKPKNGGSSVGLFRLNDRSQIESVTAELQRVPERRYLIEPFIRGPEITVGVIDERGKTRALPPSEVRLASGRDFDYDGKYLGKGSLEITPAEISPEKTEACQALAVKAHDSLGCEGYSRTDMILTGDGPVYLETNTLPGLTRASFIPQQLAAAGIEFRAFLEAQIALARKRTPKDP
jgi:D-alanine-D-alanine ligase